MAKLHEVLAVETALEGTANKLIKESTHTLSKDSLFSGMTRQLEMFRAEDKNLETTEHQKLTTTVAENLDYLVKPVAKYWDAVLTKDKTNQAAVADLIIDGKTLGKDLPATFLLGMEKKLTDLRKLYDTIPTLAPGISWIPDPTDREGVFKTEHSVVSLKSEKDAEFRVVYEATKEHPAQIEKIAKNRDTGRYIVTKVSGMMTSLEKAQRIERLDSAIRGVKQARHRANNTDIVKAAVGYDVLNYINNG